MGSPWVVGCVVSTSALVDRDVDDGRTRLHGGEVFPADEVWAFAPGMSTAPMTRSASEMAISMLPGLL